DSMRAIRLYTANIADTIIEGRASVTTGDAGDEFVEVAEENAPAAAE
ncbi:MAG: 30S ribosomal protein S2, partial [Methylophaga nitratireducenticrescens]